MEKYSGEQWKRNVLWLKISGKLEEEAYEEWRESRTELRDAVLELRLDDSEVRRKVTAEHIRKEFTEGSFPEKLLTSFSGDEEEAELQMAYELIKEVQQ